MAAKLPAHRPSRRHELVDAAIEVFAEKGYADASLGDIAERADVALTAIYYHFSGKDDLFAEAVRTCLASITEVVVAARPTGAQSDVEGLNATIDAVWEWIDQHPASAALVHVQLPGAVRPVAGIRQAFLDVHERRARDYLEGDAPKRGALDARAAIGTLRVRTLIDSLMSVHAMRLADGPLSGSSPEALRTELQRVARAILDLG